MPQILAKFSLKGSSDKSNLKVRSSSTGGTASSTNSKPANSLCSRRMSSTGSMGSMGSRVSSAAMMTSSSLGSSRRSKLTIDTDLQTTGSSVTAKPVVNSPDWEIRYDPTLSEYYYVNTKTNESQFDHPDEVLSPLDEVPSQSNSGEHRKLFRSCSLKRTISPRLLAIPKKCPSPRIPNKSSAASSPNQSAQNRSSTEIDQDVEEFKRHFTMEMHDYEAQRLKN